MRVRRAVMVAVPKVQREKLLPAPEKLASLGWVVVFVPCVNASA